MPRPATIAVGVVFAVLIAAVVWLWRVQDAVIRERDYVVWRYVSGCNSINATYEEARVVGANLQAKTNTALLKDAEARAHGLAWQLDAYAPWLEDCALDIKRVEELNRDLSAVLRLGRGDEAQAVARELRTLIPPRGNRDRSWIRIRPMP